MNYLNIAEECVAIGQKLGAEQIEAYVLEAKALTIEVSKQEVENLKFSDERGLGVRIIDQGRMGFAYITDFSVPMIEKTVRESMSNLKFSVADSYNDLPQINNSYPQLQLYDECIDHMGLEGKIDLAKQLEIAAREYDSRITKTEKSVYQDKHVEVALVNSLGTNISFKSNYCGIYAWLIAEEGGDVQTGSALDFNKKINSLNPKAVGQEAAEKAVRMLNARSADTKRVPVVFDPYVVTNFLGLFSSAVTADSVQKGKSLLAGKLNRKVVSPLITIIDDGTLLGGLASSITDGEGVPTSRTVVIEEGVLQSFLYNTYTARKEGRKSTGNGNRSGFTSTPEVGTTNFYLEKGDMSQEQIVNSVQDGFYVTEVMGMHTANPISGDFSLGASGLWILNGQFSHPVRGVAIAGNILELFDSVEAVGNDLRFFGGTGAPTVLFSKMSVSGK